MERIPDDELIGAYLDDELSTEERARAERLLVERADLRRLLDELRGVREGLRSLPSYRLEEDFPAAVLRQAEKEMLRERPTSPSPDAAAGEVPLVTGPQVAVPPQIAGSPQIAASPQIAGSPQIAASPHSDGHADPAGPSAVIPTSPVIATSPPMPASPAMPAWPVTPASLAGSAESLVPRDQSDSSAAAPVDPLSVDAAVRWRRPVMWSIIAVAASLVLMFVPPRPTGVHDDVALTPRSEAPHEPGRLREELAKRDARPTDADADAAARRKSAMGSGSLDRALDESAKRQFAGGAQADKKAQDYSAVDNGGVAIRGTAPVANLGLAASGQGRLPPTDPSAAQSALQPAASLNRPATPPTVALESLGGDSVSAVANKNNAKDAPPSMRSYAFQLDQRRLLTLAENYRSVQDGEVELERSATPLQRRLAGADGLGEENDGLLIVEVVVRPGAIESAFVPTLLSNQVDVLNTEELGEYGVSSMARDGSGPSYAAPQYGTGTPAAPAAPAAAAVAQGKAGPPAKMSSGTSPAPLDDAASAPEGKPADPKQTAQNPAVQNLAVQNQTDLKQTELKLTERRQDSQIAEFDRRESLAEPVELCYVIAEGPQLQSMLAALQSDRKNFVSIQVKPAPQIESQRGWNQYYSRSGAAPGGPRSEAASPAAKSEGYSLTDGAAAPGNRAAGGGRKPDDAPAATKPADSAQAGADVRAMGKEAGQQLPAAGPNVTSPVATTPVANSGAFANGALDTQQLGQSIAPSGATYGDEVPQSRAQRFRYTDLAVLRSNLSQEIAPPAEPANLAVDSGRGAGLGAGGAGYRGGVPPASQAGAAPAATAPATAAAPSGGRLTETAGVAGGMGAAGSHPVAGLKLDATHASNEAGMEAKKLVPSATQTAPAAAPKVAATQAPASPAPVSPTGALPIAAPAPAASSPAASSPAAPSPRTGEPSTAPGASVAATPATGAVRPGAFAEGNTPLPSVEKPMSNAERSPDAEKSAPPAMVAGQPTAGRPTAAGRPPAGPPTLGDARLAAPPVSFGAQSQMAIERSTATYQFEQQQAVVGDALRRSGRQEALFIFRVAREGEENSAAAGAADVVRDPPTSGPAVQPAAAPAAPTAKPPAGKAD